MDEIDFETDLSASLFSAAAFFLPHTQLTGFLGGTKSREENSKCILNLSRKMQSNLEASPTAIHIHSNSMDGPVDFFQEKEAWEREKKVQGWGE